MTKSPKPATEAEASNLESDLNKIAQPIVDSIAGDMISKGLISDPAPIDTHAAEGKSPGQRALADIRELADAQAAADAAPKLDLATLSYLERNINQLNITGHRLGLVDELRDLYGLQITEDDEAGTVAVTLQGISVEPADSLHTALENWGNAARRAIAEVTG